MNQETKGFSLHLIMVIIGQHNFLMGNGHY